MNIIPFNYIKINIKKNKKTLVYIKKICYTMHVCSKRVGKSHSLNVMEVL